MLIDAAESLGPFAEDRLGVLTSTWPVVCTAPQVSLHGARVRAVAAQWATTPWPPAPWDTRIHWTEPTQPERQLNWLALLDALNFCFWSENQAAPRWQVSWRETTYNGYNALAAALTRAVVDDHLPLWDAAYLAAMDETTMAEILRPAPGAPQIPLFPQRVMHTRELGEGLMRYFGGQFMATLAAAQGDAVELALLVARRWASFRDLALWEGREVYFFKRAQILVADIAAAFGGQGPGDLAYMDQLTAFADYKVPQLLRRLGILTYADELAARIAAYQPIHPGEPDEVAIRAATIWGVEWLRRELAHADPQQHGGAVTASQIDARLWLAGQIVDAADLPYHRTLTIFY